MLDQIKNFYKNSLELNNIVFILAILIAISLIWNTVSAIEKNFKLQTKVDTLADEVALLELENTNLELNNQYYRTPDYLELAARDKLGKVGPGEKVLVLPDYSDVVSEASSNEASSTPTSDEVSNFDQWLYFLFRRDPS